MKDIRSLLLALLSCGLVATWVYHIYDKTKYSQNKIAEVQTVDTTAIAQAIRDSLQKSYTATINNLDTRLDSSRNTSDSLQAALTLQINEVNRLRTEISTILKSPNTTAQELARAKQKLNELEEIVKQLRSEKKALELEKQQLIVRLDQLTGEVTQLQQGIRKLDDENKNINEKLKTSSVFVASALHFTAIDDRESKEQETSHAKRADKFIASFVLQNSLSEFLNAEVIIVITTPDGRILQSSAWDSGSFDTKTEGRKSYTRRIKFDYMKGEQKALIFSLDVDTFQKGTYTLQIWHNGQRIGEIAKALS